MGLKQAKWDGNTVLMVSVEGAKALGQVSTLY